MALLRLKAKNRFSYACYQSLLVSSLRPYHVRAFEDMRACPIRSLRPTCANQDA